MARVYVIISPEQIAEKETLPERMMYMADYIFKFENTQTTSDVADDFSLIAIKRQLEGFIELLKARDGRQFSLPLKT